MTSNNTPALRFAGFDGEWVAQPLSKLGSSYGGLTGKTKEDFGHGDARYITYLDVFERALINDASRLGATNIDNRQNEVTAGDVLFTVSSEVPEEVGMSAVWLGQGRDIYLNSFCFGFRPTVELDSKFLAYVLRSPDFRKKMTLLAQGISRFNISKLKAMELEIEHPALEEQRAIGELFADLDALIKQHRAKHANLQQTKSALMQRMFPQNEAEEPELRLGEFSGAWETVSFDSLLTRVEIGTNILGSNRYHGIPLLKMGNIQRGYFDFSSLERLPDNAELPSDSLVRKGDFLFNTRNTMELVGKGATWMGESGAFAFNGNIARFTLERVDTKFFNYLYNHPRSIQDVSKCATGTTSVAAIYPRSLKSVQFQIPTLEEQRAVGEVFTNLDALIAAESRYITQLTQAKTALLQRMFV